MLIIVVVVFIVCQLPQAIVNSLRLNHRDAKVCTAYIVPRTLYTVRFVHYTSYNEQSVQRLRCTEYIVRRIVYEGSLLSTLYDV